MTEAGDWGWFLSQPMTRDAYVALMLLQSYSGLRQRKAVEAVEWLRQRG